MWQFLGTTSGTHSYHTSKNMHIVEMKHPKNSIILKDFPSLGLE